MTGDSVKKTQLNLGRRERQIVETLHAIGEGSVHDVRSAMADAPSYSSVRTMLNILTEKGQLKYRKSGRRYLYRPVEAPAKRRKSYLQRAIDLAFGGENKLACVALIDLSADKLSDQELEEIERRVQEARQRKRSSGTESS
jgi:predicted transcriptional regulator